LIVTGPALALLALAVVAVAVLLTVPQVAAFVCDVM
jgi:hypothetical protein